jgi:UDP-N-acetylglucosamine 4,6-dehydratase/5-epimerase
MSLMDLASIVAPNAKVEITGIRPGEKLHEVLISEDEARTSVELDDMFVVMPAMSLPRKSVPLGRGWETIGKRLPDGYRFASNTNPQWLSLDQIRTMIAPIEEAFMQGKLE